MSGSYVEGGCTSRERQKLLANLKQHRFFPYQKLPAEYGKKAVWLSVILQNEAIFNMMCRVYSVLPLGIKNALYGQTKS